MSSPENATSFIPFTGTLQIFQPRDLPKKEKSIRDRGPVLVEPKSPRPTDPEPFLLKMLSYPEVVPSAVPTDLSWAEKQEQNRIAR